MAPLSFDPIADSYDATRGYPGDIAQQIARQLNQVAEASSQTAFLELGVGTGRIAFPLASLGHRYTGVDIAEKMLERLVEKLQEDQWQRDERAWGSLPDEDGARTSPVKRFRQTEPEASMRLVTSDVMHLPFRDASFDRVIAVHVLHLIDGWQQVLREALRVLRPGGFLLHCWDEGSRSSMSSMHAVWQKIVVEMGGSLERPGATSNQMVVELLQSWGLQPQSIRALTWEYVTTPRQGIERIVGRSLSSTWSIPDDIFNASAEKFWEWAHSYFGAEIDTKQKVERHFMISKTQV